ncbi:MAG: peptidase S10 [Sphingomonadales bacterium]|nr:peptidase S10 [Sphingomonadales bacterium]MDE2170784.1 peptidase S10 [Sphingomonadales bacterium]
MALSCARGLLRGAAMALVVASGPAGARNDSVPSETPVPGLFQSRSDTGAGSVTVDGHRIDYHSVAGTLVIHAADWDDTETAGKPAADATASPEASIFYVAYFKDGAPSENRPITFLYNGGPGSSTLWLHMGAFGPRRVALAADGHTPAAPYAIVNNEHSLLDRSDLVFVDAPGTGFSRIAGKDKEKAFLGIDADASAFSSFIKAFLTRYSRWNSPKYLFGESYGTPRTAVLVNKLTTEDEIDFNGIVLLSQFLDLHLLAEWQGANPDSVVGYVTQLPTFAATAWYHDLIPGGKPADLKAFLAQAEEFAATDYAAALLRGSEIDPATRSRVAQKMAGFTGLPVDYILKANLRVDGPEFAKELQQAHGLTTGRLDSRYSGPDLDPLSKSAEYYPDSAAFDSAYVSAFNAYVREELHYRDAAQFKPVTDILKNWDWNHPTGGYPALGWAGVNTMPDLAQAMKYNPHLKVMVAGGYYDLVTPYFQGWFEMHHLLIPDILRRNIEYHYYQSGHMVYVNPAAAAELHADIGRFIDASDNVPEHAAR